MARGHRTWDSDRDQMTKGAQDGSGQGWHCPHWPSYCCSLQPALEAKSPEASCHGHCRLPARSSVWQWSRRGDVTCHRGISGPCAKPPCSLVRYIPPSSSCPRLAQDLVTTAPLHSWPGGSEKLFPNACIPFWLLPQSRPLLLLQLEPSGDLACVFLCPHPLGSDHVCPLCSCPTLCFEHCQMPVTFRCLSFHICGAGL